MNRPVRIYIDKEGRTLATLAESERLEDELCDFCSLKSPPYKVYKCRDFPIPMMPGHWSRGEWNACTLCAELIDANNYLLLLRRCVEIMKLEPHQITPMGILHQEFAKNRIQDNE